MHLSASLLKPSYVRNLNDSDITTYNEAVRLVIERENIDTAKRNILVSHQFYTAAGREPETSDRRDPHGWRD